MILHDQIGQSLKELRGLTADEPQTALWTAADGPAVEADFTAVDTLSCAIRELRVSSPAFLATPFEDLKAWAESICRKVTYLLEHIGPLELDAAAGTVLVRSTPPTQESARISYYEMQAQSPGTVNLRRYVRERHTDDRQQVDIHLTHEALQKLVRDIVEAIPCIAQQ